MSLYKKPRDEMSESIDGKVAMVEVITVLENEIEQMQTERDRLAEINKVLSEALEFAIEDMSRHWEDDCKVPPSYALCDHCYLKEQLAKAKEMGK